MAENKTKPTDRQVSSYLQGIEDPFRREDCREVAALMEEITGETPVMWDESLVGFGKYRYKYASGREGEWFKTGFSSRKQSLTIYIAGYLENHNDIMKRLGKFKTGKGCLYIKRLTDVEKPVLKELIETSIRNLPVD